MTSQPITNYTVYNAEKTCRARWESAYTAITEYSCMLTYKWFYNNKSLYLESFDLPVSVELSSVLLPVRFMAKEETEGRIKTH